MQGCACASALLAFVTALGRAATVGGYQRGRDIVPCTIGKQSRRQGPEQAGYQGNE